MPLVMLLSVIVSDIMTDQALVQPVVFHSQCVVIQLMLLHCTAMMVRMMCSNSSMCVSLNIIVYNMC